MPKNKLELNTKESALDLSKNTLEDEVYVKLDVIGEGGRWVWWVKLGWKLIVETLTFVLNLGHFLLYVLCRTYSMDFMSRLTCL